MHSKLSVTTQEIEMTSQIPVLNKSGFVVGYVSIVAHKKASSLANSNSVKQEFRHIEGRKILCWIPV